MTRPPTSPTPRLRGRKDRTVASFGTYAEAERAIDRLSDRRFPVERTAIVARDLSFVETVTGRRDLARAVLDAAASGALIGALLGFIFGLFNWIDPLVSALALLCYGALLGALAGALTGLLLQALSGGRRDFASAARMEAGTYDVVVDDDWADDASRVLGSDRPQP